MLYRPPAYLFFCEHLVKISNHAPVIPDHSVSDVKSLGDFIAGNHEYMAISSEVMNLLGENPATELEDINQEITSLQKDILAGVKAHRDITGLAERVQQLRSRKTEIEAGQAVEERDRERIKALRESIEKSKDKVLAYDEKLVRNFIKEIKIFPDKLTITMISGAHEDITI